MHELYAIKEMLMDELKQYSQEGLTTGSLDVVDKLAHALKNLCKIIEVCEMEEEYSSRGSSYEGGSSYRGGGGSSMRGGSSYAYGNESMAYARGRGRGARRDSMGRYASEGYARAAAYEEENMRMKERLKQIMSDTPDERTRRMLNELASEMS